MLSRKWLCGRGSDGSGQFDVLEIFWFCSIAYWHGIVSAL
jgi:hypothetical protein